MIIKKLVLTSFVVFSFLSSFGQFNKGRMLIGGTSTFSFKTDKTSFGNTTTTTGKTTNLSLEPTVGYFFADNFAAGFGVTLGQSSYKSETIDYKFSVLMLLVAPFVRYYLKPGIFFEGMYGIGPAKTSVSGASEDSYTMSSGLLGVGYAWFLNDHVAVEPTINYSTLVLNIRGSKYIDSDINFGLGLQVYLGRK